MSKYKTYEELKEELGNKLDEYMYKSNIELLTKIDKAIEYIENYCIGNLQYENKTHKVLLNILKGDDNV